MTPNKSSTAPDCLDPEESPEFLAPDLSTPDWQAKFATTPVRRGRPRVDTPKVSTTIRIDPDVLAAFRAKGPGWQSRMNAALREWLVGR